MSRILYHITNQELVDDALAIGSYHCASLMNEGFVHCCHLEQLPGVVERYYSGEPELCLLIIDRDLLGAPVKFENTVGGAELFPHVYGSVNITAVTEIKKLSAHALQEFATVPPQSRL